MELKMKNIAPKLKDAILKMYSDLKDSYDGFYCTLCNADSQMFISQKKKVFLFQRKMCREILSSTLPVALYLHKNLIDYLNLISLTLHTCSYSGIFEKKTIPKKFKFFIPKTTDVMLKECKEYRNDIKWFAFCKDICDRFNPI